MKNIISLALIFAMIGCGAKENVDYQKEAENLHKEIVTLDSHTDTPLRLLDDDFEFTKKHDPYKTGSRIDLPRMKEGSLDAAFFAVFIGQGKRNPEKYKEVKDRSIRIFDAIHELVDENQNEMGLAITPEDAEKLKQQDKKAIYIGVENGYPIGKDLTLLKEFYDRGARYITLCHTKNNDICDSSTDPDGPEHNGLSLFGEDVVAEMNKLGLMIDVSHIADSAFYDVLEFSKAPVLASHSCSRALCENPRNLSDEMLKSLAENDGVIQMCILSAYVKDPLPNPKKDSARTALREKYNNFQDLTKEERNSARKEWYELNRKFPDKLANVSDVVDHIDHIVNLVGIDHIGIGTDFDGGGGVEGCYDVSELKNITVELLKRGYSKEEIKKIWSGNFLRVFKKVEEVAGKLRKNT